MLGINAFHAGASAAVVVDGEPVSAIAEERLNRIKYYAGFPSLAIQKCLEMANMRFRDLDYVAVGRDPGANRFQKIAYALRHPWRLFNFLSIYRTQSGLDDLEGLISRECDVPRSNLEFEQVNVEHHLAHVSSAYFVSPWDHCAGFSMDGSGDFTTCMLTECRGKEIEVLHRVHIPHSMGFFYTMICQFLGYCRYGDEGKVMGLAPYGEDVFREHFVDMVDLTEDGFRLNQEYFQPFGSNQGISVNEEGRLDVQRLYSDHMVELFGEPREPHSEITERDKNLAFGMQRRFEETYFHVLNRLHERVPTDRVAMAGGSALNSAANGKIFERTPFEETVIQPAAGDDGLALGAALYVSQSMLDDGDRYHMERAQLGPEYSDGEIVEALEGRDLSYRKVNRPELLKTTAEAVRDGEVVGWFQGRMEWGPRALGNRSILADPRREETRNVLNERVKNREWFRPFAPSVLADRQDDIFEGSFPSPFMLHVYKIRPEWRDRLAAVNHVDNTGRLQSVTRDQNPLYYDLIEHYDQLTGVPVVLNTSFNEREPIVCSPDDAIECFQRTKMDLLVMGSILCRSPGR